MSIDPQPRLPDRRDFLWRSGGGLGGIALASMLGRDGAFGATSEGLLADGVHHPAKAKRVVQLFMAGAASHLDLFDYKPALVRHHGEKSDFGEHVGVLPVSPLHFSPQAGHSHRSVSRTGKGWRLR